MKNDIVKVKQLIQEELLMIANIVVKNKLLCEII